MPTSLNFSQVFPQVFLSFPQLFRRTQGMDRLSPGTPASFAASSSPGASAADAPGLPPGLQEPNEETETLSWIIWIFGHIYACICVIKCLCIYICTCVYIYVYIHVCVLYVKPTQTLGTKHVLSIFGVAITIYHHSHSEIAAHRGWNPRNWRWMVWTLLVLGNAKTLNTIGAICSLRYVLTINNIVLYYNVL